MLRGRSGLNVRDRKGLFWGIDPLSQARILCWCLPHTLLYVLFLLLLFSFLAWQGILPLSPLLPFHLVSTSSYDTVGATCVSRPAVSVSSLAQEQKDLCWITAKADAAAARAMARINESLARHQAGLWSSTRAQGHHIFENTEDEDDGDSSVDIAIVIPTVSRNVRTNHLSSIQQTLDKVSEGTDTPKETTATHHSSESSSKHYLARTLMALMNALERMENSTNQSLHAKTERRSRPHTRVRGRVLNNELVPEAHEEVRRLQAAGLAVVDFNDWFQQHSHPNVSLASEDTKSCS